MQQWNSTFKKTRLVLATVLLLVATGGWSFSERASPFELATVGKTEVSGRDENRYQREGLLARDVRAQRRAEPGLPDSLLIDSILTIVQNYYVDENRVDNQKLMEETLKSLEVQDLVRLSFPGPDVWNVQKNGETLTLKIPRNYIFDDLVRDGLKLSRLLDRHEKPKAPRKPSKSGARLVVNAMLAGLDPHSNLLDPEEYRDLRQGTEGSFGGLGVVVGMQDDVLTVVKPLPKSPASRAGVDKLDRIMAIDDKNTFGTTLDDLIQYMRGEPGTKVRLSLLREGDLAPRNILLTREVIQVDSVESKIIQGSKGNIIYAFIDSFSSRTAAELREALIKNQQGKLPIEGIILDMRSNPGGLLDQAVKVADLFLDEGKILTTQGRSREYDMAKKNLFHFDYPIAILTNGDTASASEIVAGALRDHGRAIVIGEPSFGKGSVQTVFELPGEQALKLTIARYYTPKGISIQNTGITPDIWLQPVIKNSKNMNLLGEYRYKSERFLDHSLEVDKSKQISNARAQKAYYLVSESKKEPEVDVPLNFATKLLGELAKRDGLPYPKSRLRASYWKASADAFVKKTLNDFDQSANDWLLKDKKVNWSEGVEAFDDDRSLQFAVSAPKRFTLAEGKAVEVPYQIKNTGKKSIHRLSVYLSGIHSVVGTNEVLVGKIEPGETLSGTIKFDLKVSAKEGSLRMRAGLARSGWPVSGKEREFIIELFETKKPDIQMSMSLVSEEGGSQPGVLEPGEKGKIKVLLKNTSQILAKKVTLKLVGLIGKQAFVDVKPQNVGDLKPGESRAVLVSVAASQQIVNTELKFGALLETEELVESNKMHFALPSSPKTRMSKSDVLTGTGPWKEN